MTLVNTHDDDTPWPLAVEKSCSKNRLYTVSVARQRRGLHHVIVHQRVPSVPGLVVPVLYLVELDASGSETLRSLDALTQYFIASSACSLAWMLERARGVGMFYDYLTQCGADLQRQAQSAGSNYHRIAIQRFCNHVLHGTVTFGRDYVPDPTELYWAARSRASATALLRGIPEFTQFLEDTASSETGVVQTPVDAQGLTNFVRVAVYKRNFSFLAHLKRASQAKKPPTHGVFGPGRKSIDAPDNVQFPRRLLAPLLIQGFRSSRGRGDQEKFENATARLMATICAIGGLRSSEPLHLWVEDVQLVKGKLEVLLQHPQVAQVSHPQFGTMSRADYLRRHCGLEPRNSKLAGKYKAGWKGIGCDAQWRAVLHPLPVPGAAEFLSNSLNHYLTKVRPQLIRRRLSRGLPDHPFLLVSSGGSNRTADLSSVGDPYTAAAFRSAWTKAIMRLREQPGDENLSVRKQSGTTPHGLRHLYGSLLREAGLSPEVIQRCMHHLSPLSQQTYTKPRSEEINNVLTGAMLNSSEAGTENSFAAFKGTNELLDDLRNGSIWSVI